MKGARRSLAVLPASAVLCASLAAAGLALPASNAAFVSTRSPGGDTLTAAASFGTHSSNVLADSPAGYWRMNTTPTYAADSSTAVVANQHPGGIWHGVTSTANRAQTGDGDRAMTFGGQEGVQVETGNFAFTGTSAYSVEAWVSPTTLDGNFRNIVNCMQPATYPDVTGWSIWVNDTTLSMQRYYTGNSSTFSQVYSPAALPLNSYTHVVVTYDGSAMRIYLNGNATPVAVQADTNAMANIGACTLMLGAADYQPNSFAGDLDEVAVYGTALSGATINTHYNRRASTSPSYAATVLADAPIGYWRLGDTPAPTPVTDTSGSSRTATGTGLLSQVAGPFGGTALHFNGHSGVDRTDAAYVLGGTSPWTIEAWVRATTVDGNRRTIARCEQSVTPKTGWYLTNTTTGLTAERYDSTGTAAGPNATALATGTWTFVTVTYDGTTTSLYTNGTLRASAPDARALPTGACTLQLGFATDQVNGAPQINRSNSWIGDLGEVAIFGSALSADRVMEHYQRQS